MFRLELENSIRRLLRKFKKPSLPRNENGEIFLHLGCGKINHPKFVNIDAICYPHVHYVRSINDLSIFSDCSIKFIYACHCLEHFSHRDTANVLKEWNRVLVRGGVLRISVPDFDKLVHIYNKSGRDINSMLMQLFGGQDYKFNYHFTAFNETSLKCLLADCGFSFSGRWIPDKKHQEEFNDFSSYTLNINGESCDVSLNIEGVK